MTRKKVKLAFITNDSARKATYKKRKKGLMKKVNELSTLCGIDACAIIYSPYESQPETWPENNRFQHVLAQFMRMPEMERSKNMLTLESFTRKMITKTNGQLKKQMKENREKEMTEVMYQCLTGKGSIANLTLPDLNELGGLVDQTLKDISRRIEALTKGVPGKAIVAPPPPPPPPPPPSLPPPPPASGGGNSLTTMVVENVSGVDGLQRTQWFTDWMNNPSEQNFGLNRGYEMTQFTNNPNPIWPNPYFP